MYCSNCGKELPDGIKFCPECGQQIGTIPQQQPQTVIVQMPRQPKSRAIAALLCIFLGMIGIHDFYMERNGAGLAKILINLVLGWFIIGLFIVGIWCLFDLILIAFSEEECFLTDEEINQKKQQKAMEEQKVRDYYNKRREELNKQKES